MNKLILNFICKDEQSTILRMLESNKTIADAIVACDTGSTDKTIELINKFGQDNNIPTFVFERPFDNFRDSRNHGMEMARQTVDKLGWNREEVHTYWCDCDEIMVVEKSFDKSSICFDLLMINTRISNNRYTRNTFARTSQPFEWYGVVHEYIICRNPNITSGLAENIWVDVHMDGKSWSDPSKIHEKYRKHANLLEQYINNEDRSSRWIFYVGQSHHDSSQISNPLEREERLRRAMHYYKERVDTLIGYEEERFYSQFRIGTILEALEMPWSETHQALMKAYSMDPRRAEPISFIIQHYIMVGEYNLAYVYSTFAKANLHGKNPYGPTCLLFIDESQYNWRLLELHTVVCYNLKKMNEAAQTFNEILTILKEHPEYFTQEDANKIQMNMRVFGMTTQNAQQNVIAQETQEKQKRNAVSQKQVHEYITNNMNSAKNKKELKNIYKNLMSQFHTDTNGNTEENKVATQLINHLNTELNKKLK